MRANIPPRPFKPCRAAAAVLLLFAAFLLPRPLLAAAPEAASKNSRMDWPGLKLYGYADPEAEAEPLRAELSARKHLLEALRSLPLTAEQSVGALLDKNSRAAERVRILVHGSPVGNAQEALGPVRTAAGLPLAGEVLGLVLPSPAGFGTGIAPRLSAKAVAALPSLEGVEKSLLRLRARTPVGARPLDAYKTPAAPVPPAPELPDEEHTGLVVDARGLPASAALLPVVYDESGVGLYGAFLVSRAHVVRFGLVVYARSLDAAELTARAGAAPLVVKASGLAPVQGQEGGPDLVLGPAEAQAARSLLRSKDVLARCAVVILTD